MRVLNKRIVDPIKSLLLQGVTPEDLAWSLTAGVVLGIFPALGTTTLLCGLFSWQFRLNPVAIQLVNWLVYPLQLLLLIPFWQWGDRLFGYRPIEITPGGLQELLSLGWMEAVTRVGWTSLRGMLLWGLVAAPLAYILQRLLRSILRGLLEKRR